MASREEKIAEMAKLLASGAITTEEFTRIIDALNESAGQISETPDEINEEPPLPMEMEYIRIMEDYVKEQISPATSTYPPFSVCDVDDRTRWDFIYQKIPCLRLFTEELLVIHSYIDGQNNFGAMVRDLIDIVIDVRERVIISIRINERDSNVEPSITYQYPNQIIDGGDDSIENELFEKYIIDALGENCAYIPFNKKMLCEEDVPLLNGQDYGSFVGVVLGANNYVTGHVYYIVTSVAYVNEYGSYKTSPLIIVLDSFSTFNLIRLFFVPTSGVRVIDGKAHIQTSSDSIDYTHTWKLSDSPSTAQAVKISTEQAVQDKMSGVNKAADVPIQALLEQVDYNKIEESYNACMQNLLTNNRKYKGCSYPPFNKSMLKVRDIMGLKDEKTCSYEIHTSMSKLFMKIDLTIYLKDLVSCEVLEVK